ncbi:MAG: NAD(P)H-binding protein [Vicinamibacterales bacterium]
MNLVVTGATGFVGARLVPRLVARGHHVVAVSRRPAEGGMAATVAADVRDVDTLASVCRGVDAVLHLAATTGKASAAEHAAVNLEGTRAIVEACRRAGVPCLLFVSSIAAGFADLRDYPYGRAKRDAEAVVRTSGLRTTIVRPTAIFGPGSPVQRGLAGLALAPFVPVVGSGRTPLQPVHVDDVAQALADLVEADRFDGETVDLGGPEALAVEALLVRMREAAGRGRGPVLHLPPWLVLTPLRVGEALGLGAVLPVSAGQFSSFLHSGAATPHPWTAGRAHTLVPLDAMLAVAPATHALAPVDPPDVLAAECAVFTRHVLGVAPAPTVVDAYVRAHAVSPRFRAVTAFDQRLVAVARRGPLVARLADAHARLLDPAGLLRRKLVLLLALLETTPPHYRAVDAPLAASLPATLLALAGRGLAAAAVAALGLLLFLPLRLTARGPVRA